MLSSDRVWESVASTTSCECTATRSCKSKEPLKFTTRLDSDPLKGSSRVLRRTTQRRPVRNRVQKSARHRGSGTPGSTHRSQTDGLLQKQPLETRLPRSLKQPPPPTSALLMTKTKPRQSCTFRRRPRQRKKRGSKQLEVCRDLASQTRQYQPSNTAPPPLKRRTAMTWTSQRPESRLSAAQLQAQLARLTDRTRLRGLKSTLLSKGA